MAAFLDQFAQEILRVAGLDADRYCVVLPNRRAGLFLKRFMASHIDKPAWLPAVYSIEDFILYLSGYRLTDPVALLFELYQAHLEVEGTNAQPFDEFIVWGKDLVNDFNEIDQYLVDPEKLFTYLSDAKAITLWNLDQEPLTPFQNKYLEFYRSLGTYHSVLSERLIRAGQVYQGLAYRLLARKADEGTLEIPWSKVFFGGFNALTSSEKKIIGHLTARGVARIFWDADGYYLDNSSQEAGRFLREYRDHPVFGPFQWTGQYYKEEEKEIEVIGVPRNIGQVKVAGKILAGWQTDRRDSLHTALVLVEENLLLPMLNSIPEEIREFNITMGYPLKYTPFFDLLESVFIMHENAERFYQLSGNKNWRFYYKDVLRVLNHPYILALAADSSSVERKTGELISSGNVFYNPVHLSNAFTGTDPVFAGRINSIFQQWDRGFKDPLRCFTNLIEVLKDQFIAEQDPEKDLTGLEYLYHYAGILARIQTLLEQYPVISDIRTLRSLISQLARYETIPFYGEPLKGLQIMGMLETRNLDFENLILLSVNEDLIPAGKMAHSFIPFDIKIKFGLPTYRERDAVFAYHFYRLLQRAKNIKLIYNTESTELGGGEQSRFITQLIHELPKYNPGIRITRKLLSVPPGKNAHDPAICIEKNPVHLGKLLELADKGLSPTSLNTYRNCTLQFYFRYVAGLEEKKEVEETIDAATLGTVMHEVMSTLYKPFEGKVLRSGDLEAMASDANQLTEKVFSKTYPLGDMNYGKNLLIVNMAKVLIRNYLTWEKEFIQSKEKEGFPLTILGIEQTLKSTFKVRFGEESIDVAVKGTADRIDRFEDQCRIIDYKTGQVRARDLSVKEWDLLESGADFGKSFQVLVYGYLFRSSEPEFNGRIVPGIISFRTPGEGLMEVKLPEKVLLNDTTLDHFRDILQVILDEIYNKEIPFHATTEPENCEFCPYREICNR